MTVHGGRRFTVVPGTMHMEASEFGLTLGEVRFFDDDAPAETGEIAPRHTAALDQPPPPSPASVGWDGIRGCGGRVGGFTLINAQLTAPLHIGSQRR